MVRVATNVRSIPLVLVLSVPPVAVADVVSRSAPLPVVFEENLGQGAEPVRYLGRGPGWSAGFETRRVTLRHGPEQLRLEFVGASPHIGVRGEGPLPGRSGYFGGPDPAAWVPGARHYDAVVYEEIYPGIDAIFYENGGRLEYDFRLSAGADAALIRLRFREVRQLEITEAGELVLRTAKGEIRQAAPRTHQMVKGERRAVASRYELRAGNEVGFALEGVDPAWPLVIDPLVYSTYFGGTGQVTVDHFGVDSAGNLYFAGTGGGIDFPATDGAGFGLYVAKIDPTRPGREGLRYSGFLQGVRSAAALEVDGSGRIYIAGGGDGSPTALTANAFQTASTGGSDAFLTVLDLDEDGTRVLVYSSLFGGSGLDEATVMALGEDGRVYLSGTGSDDLPTSEGAFQQEPGAGRWVAVFDPSRNGAESLLYSTFFNAEFMHLQPDVLGNVHMAGRCIFFVDPETACPVTTENAFQPECSLGPGTHCQDVYYGVLQPGIAGPGSLLYATFLGGANSDVLTALKLDAHNRALLAGTTLSPDFPTSEASLGQPCPQHDPDCDSLFWTDAFVSLVDSTLLGEESLVFSQRFGGDDREFEVMSFSGSSSKILLVGSTQSEDLPTTPTAFQRECIPDDRGFCSSSDLFVARFDPAAAEGESLRYASRFGGENHETFFIPGAAIDAQDRVYVTGRTRSRQFPTTRGAIERGIPFVPSDRDGQAFFFARVDTRLDGPGTLSYSTLLSGFDRFQSPQVHLVVSGERAYLATGTSSPDFPVTSNGFDRTCGFGGLFFDGSCARNVVVFVIDPVPGPTIEPSEAEISFEYLIPDPIPLTLPMNVATDDPSLTIRVIPETEGDWLSFVPRKLAGGGDLDILFDPSALRIGIFEGLLRFQSDDPYIRRTLQVTANVDAAPPGNILGILNAASFADQSVAPGEIVSIFGSNLGPVGGIAATAADGNIQGPEGTWVFVEGENRYGVPVLFARHDQLNVIVPYHIAGERLVTFRVQTARGESPGFGVTVAPSAPGLFTLSGTGQGRGAILNQDGTVNSAENPAEQGSIIVLFGTGEGQTDPPGITGRLIEPPISALVEAVRVTVDGQEAEVLFAGPAPGFAGLLQVNIRLPASVSAGDTVAIRLIVAGISSPDLVTVAIR